MKVGVIGSGSMGSGIAQVAAMAGCEVKIYDADAFAVKRALQNIGKSLSKLVEKGIVIARNEATEGVDRKSVV